MIFFIMMIVVLVAGFVLGKAHSEGMDYNLVVVTAMLFVFFVIIPFAGISETNANDRWEKGATIVGKGIRADKPYVELRKTMGAIETITADKYIRLNIGDKY